MLVAFALSLTLFKDVESNSVEAGIAAPEPTQSQHADLLIAPVQIRTVFGTFTSTPAQLGLTYEESQSPQFSLDEGTFTAAVLDNFPAFTPPVDAKINVDAFGRAAVVSSIEGKKVDVAKFKEDLAAQVEAGQLGEITLEVAATDAAYTTDMATADKLLLQGMLKQKMNFFYTEAPEKTDNFPMIFNPAWVTVKNSQYIFNEPDIRAYIKDTIATELNRTRTDAIIKSLPEEGSLYANVEGRAFDGWEVDQEKTYQNFKEKISQKSYDFPIEVKITQGKVINETGTDLGDLQQLSQGKSGFWGSALGRKANIIKGLNERLANILLAPGEEFSFNKFIGEVDGAHGWKPALAIFGGTELVPVPGGGLCQVSTTFYRAIVRAGLEVLEKSNHTLYITYYEEYGNGLDAAVYPGSKDFRFRNNTDNYIFIESYTDRDIGYVDIYGTPMHKNVEMIGPLYHGKVPAKFKDKVDPNWNEIAWIQKITGFDGSITENIIMGKYKTGPRKWYMYQDPEENLSS